MYRKKASTFNLLSVSETTRKSQLRVMEKAFFKQNPTTTKSAYRMQQLFL